MPGKDTSVGRKFKLPVTIQTYIGSGDSALELKQRIYAKATASKQSASEFILDLMRKSDPSLFKEGKNAK
jgi:hypothetical protein